MSKRVEAEELMIVYAGISGWARRAWDSVRLRAVRRKCIVSGCEIPPRGTIGKGIVAEPWPVCGVHRKPVSEVLQMATSDYREAVTEAKRKHVVAVVNGLNDLGCHEDEIALAG